MAAPLVNRRRDARPGRVPLPKPARSGSMPVLAPYAVEPRSSRGRLIDEPPSDTRSPYARDRDRILHATAFRRLNYKTQVFIYHEGDHYRSRLTHSLEVAQIARALARTLRVDEDLTEASGAGARSRPSAVRPCRRARARRRHGGRRRLRPQCAVAARRHRARKEICALRRTQSHLGDAGGSGEA